VCSDDLALGVSRFCTDVSVSDNFLVTIDICCAYALYCSDSTVVYLKTAAHGVARGVQRGHVLPQTFRKYSHCVSCFERRFSKQNSVICLKSNILALPISGQTTPLLLHLVV